MEIRVESARFKAVHCVAASLCLLRSNNVSVRCLKQSIVTPLLPSEIAVAISMQQRMKYVLKLFDNFVQPNAFPCHVSNRRDELRLPTTLNWSTKTFCLSGS